MVTDLAAFLAGRWDVERTLRHGDERGAFVGTATFEREGDGLVWDEEGELRLESYDGSASRRLRIVPAPPAWEVRFDDGRPFHPLDLAGGRCAAVHHCGPDLYEGEYVVLGDGALDVFWRVTGPEKDQEIVSRYRRPAAPRPGSG